MRGGLIRNMRPIRRRDKLLSASMALLVCFGVAMFWAGSCATELLQTTMARAGLGVDIWAPPEACPRCWAWAILWAGMILGGYFWARARPHLPWLVAGYIVLPMVGALGQWILLASIGFPLHPTPFTTEWSLALIAYGAGYLFAAPSVWEAMRKTPRQE